MTSTKAVAQAAHALFASSATHKVKHIEGGPGTAELVRGFQESRIYAQGWNASRKRLNLACNPYLTGHERTIWLKGYHARNI
jgi:hypothetical protein